MTKMLLWATLVLTLVCFRENVIGQSSQEEEESEFEEFEYAPYDGWYNNLAHPDWGAGETQLFRLIAPPAYSDGVYEPAGMNRPNPIEISDIVFRGKTGEPSLGGRTAMLAFYGQQMVEEILDAQRPGCPPEFINIPVPENHPLYDKDGQGNIEMPLIRARFDQNTGLSPNAPRQQLNEISSFIDGTLMYGPTKAWSDGVRAFVDGKMAFEMVNINGTETEVPPLNTIRLPMANPPNPRSIGRDRLSPVGRFYRLGNPRGMENPFLLTFGLLWFRYHNYRAEMIKIEHPTWNDEQIFNEARKWVIATHQSISVYEWLPSWLSNGTESVLKEYEGYDHTIHPGISNIFATSAMRFGHTQVPPGVFRRGKPSPGDNQDCTFFNTTEATSGGKKELVGQRGLRTCNAYWNSQEGVDEHGIEAVLMGMASQVTENADQIITPDLRDDVFGPMEFSRRPLMAINIQRGRDHGVPDYNTVREELGLERIDSFANFTSKFAVNDIEKEAIIDELDALYGGRMDDHDLWSMGMLETLDDVPGETFRKIIIDQFTRIRDGDRFWFENDKNGLFTEEEIEMLRKFKLSDVIINSTNIDTGDIQKSVFFWRNITDPCEQPLQLKDALEEENILENCTDLQFFDYFDSSRVSFALSFTGLFAILGVVIGLLILLAKLRDRQLMKAKSLLQKKAKRKSEAGLLLGIEEWVGKKEDFRDVQVQFVKQARHIIVKSTTGKKLRVIDLPSIAQFGKPIDFIMSADKGMRMLQIKIPREYDMVLRFPDSYDKDGFYQQVKDFITECGVGITSAQAVGENSLKNNAFTKENRQKMLDRFFRAVFAHAFNMRLSHVGGDDNDWDIRVAEDIINCELTRLEFADALALKPDSVFVNSMFEIVDKDGNGFISFREFLDMFVILSKGSADEKAKLMFDMYDLNGNGTLTTKEFETMIKSLLELANDSMDETRLNDLVKTIFVQLGNKPTLNFQDFNKIMKDFKADLNCAGLTLNVEGGDEMMRRGQGNEGGITRARKTIMQAYNTLESPRDKRKSRLDTIDTIQNAYPESTFARYVHVVRQKIATYRFHIFWLVLYTLVTIGVFVERAYYYSVEREHAGLRRIAGYGVSITRGAASGMMFTYSCLLVTMSRNTITFLRETFLHRFIPFDSAVAFHKYIAWIAAAFTVMHLIGHSLNFYHISTQAPSDVACLFRNFFNPTHIIPDFNFWLWGTITGWTGILCTVICFIIYTFAIPYARRHTYKAFWIAHHFYIALYIFMIMHGAGRLVQPPFFHYFFLGPAVLFTLDKLVSVSRKKVEIAVFKAELLPSDVTKLVFQKPQGFDYKSGQWVRIACLAHSGQEYHPFTLTSAPHEDFLSLHIRAVGPWTMNIRRIYDPDTLKDHALPKVFLDGPYGEGHQDWYKYEVAVLVGGGIGVTPFAAILKDIADRSARGERIACKKVYFVWVTRTQKGYEWMTDIIKEVEEKDKRGLVNVHIFITQFKEKYDFRTTMLYVCERYFQKISQRSLFTGLKSITHFGRPNFEEFFRVLQAEHSKADVFGVFSCGPPPMTLSVDKGCQAANAVISNAIFKHHFENF